MRVGTPTCTTKKINKPCSFSATLLVVPPSGMLLCLFHSLKSIFISVALVSVVSGNIRVGPTGRQAKVLLVLRSSVASCSIIRAACQPLPPSGGTPFLLPLLQKLQLSHRSFLVPKLARAYRTLLCCLVCWCGWAVVAGPESVCWTSSRRIDNTCGLYS